MTRCRVTPSHRRTWIALLIGTIVVLGAVSIVSDRSSAGAARPFVAGAQLADRSPAVGMNVTVSATPTNGTVPLTVQFTVNVTGGAPPFRYLWQFGDANNSGYLNSSTTNHTYTRAGTFGVEVNVTNATGYTDYVTGPVIDVSPPPPVLWLQVSTSGGTVPLNFGVTAQPIGCSPECNVTIVMVNATTVVPLTSVPGPFVPNGQNLTETATITSPGTWIINAVASQPGGGGANASWTIVATAPSSSPFLVNISASATTGTAPLAVVLAANFTGGSAPYWAAWSFGDGGNGTGAVVNHTFVQPGTYTVRLYATDANGTPAESSRDIFVTNGTSGSAALSATLIASPNTGVAPLASHLLVNASGGTAPYSLTVCSSASNCSFTQTDWDGAAENLTAVYSSSGNFTATATVTDADGDQVVASALVSVAAYTPLNVSASDTVRAGSSPLEVELEASLRGGVAPYTVQWAFGDGTFGSSYSGAIVDHIYATAGRYVPVVTVRDETGHEVSQTLAAIVVPGTASSGTSSGPFVGAAGTTALIAVGALAGAGAVYVIGQGAQRRRLRREGDEIVNALRNEGRSPP